MRTLALALAALVAVACSGNSGTSKPPPAPIARDEPAADETGAGFASPPPADEPRHVDPTTEVPPELAERIKKAFGDECRFERACGELIGVDCKAAVDGPYYYVRRDSLEVVSRCGGYCMTGCTNCPPSTWTCATY